jgi:ppGpp synthetase/RelA/SpoT-type nucleotidyltranferase
MAIDASGIKQHVEQSMLAYVKVRESYSSFAEAVKKILEPALSGFPIHTIQARAKAFDSFAEKASKLHSETNELRYPSPLTEITDLAGVRVITYVPRTVSDVEDVIRREFVVQERLDKDAALLGAGRIGYKSIHFLVRLKEPRTQAAEYSRFKDQTAEIQVRTILQHAWAEMEHDIQYKSDQQIPNELKRRFVALAGLIEIADREFESIQKEDERLRTELTIELTEGLLQLEKNVATSANVVDIAQSSTVINALGSQTPEIEAALGRYDRLIVTAPDQYAHYLGRAKARFLLGDRSGALEDLEKAENLSPGNEQVSTVRQRIDEGRVSGKSYATAAPAQYANQGNRQLAQGEIGDAVASFTKAAQFGLSKIHSSFNFAMCACLVGDLPEVERNLDSVTPHKGSFIEINHLALRLIASTLRKENTADIPTMTALLKELIGKIGTYELENSPLRFLVAALQLNQKEGAIEPILDVLHHARSTG